MAEPINTHSSDAKKQAKRIASSTPKNLKICKKQQTETKRETNTALLTATEKYLEPSFLPFNNSPAKKNKKVKKLATPKKIAEKNAENTIICCSPSGSRFFIVT